VAALEGATVKCVWERLHKLSRGKAARGRDFIKIIAFAFQSTSQATAAADVLEDDHPTLTEKLCMISERLLPGVAAPAPNMSIVRFLPIARVQEGDDSSANSAVYQVAVSPMSS
jgi:hypothetical protein